MGSSSSKTAATVPTKSRAVPTTAITVLPKLSPPTTIATATKPKEVVVRKECYPYLFRLAPGLINSLLARQNGILLPEYETCKLGMLRDINFCNLVAFTLENEKTCDISFVLHSLRTMDVDAPKIEYFNAKLVPSITTSTTDVDVDEVYNVEMDINFGTLEGKMTVTPEDKNCAKHGTGVIADLQLCDHTSIVVGTKRKPVIVHVELLVPMHCNNNDSASTTTTISTSGSSSATTGAVDDTIKIKNVHVDIDQVLIQCPNIMDKLAGNLDKHIINEVSTKLDLILSTVLGQVLNQTTQRLIAISRSLTIRVPRT